MRKRIHFLLALSAAGVLAWRGASAWQASGGAASPNAQEVTQNGAIKITPLRNPKLKGVAVIYVGETYRDASYKLRVVNQITAFSNRGDATTHLEKGSMVAVSVMPSLGVESLGE